MEKKYMKKRKRFMAATLILALVLSGCSPSKEQDKAETGSKAENKTEKPVKEKAYQSQLDVIEPAAYGNAEGLQLEKGSYISIIGKAKEGQYWETVQKGVKQAEKDINKLLGYEGKDQVKVTYIAPSKADNVDEQVNILDEELARYPVAVGIAIADEQACEVQFDLAADSGIPVVAFDSGSDYQGLLATVSTDNTESARMAADKLAESMEDQGEVVIFAHSSSSRTGKEREHAFKEQMKKAHPNIKIAEIYRMDDVEKIEKAIAKEKQKESSAEKEVDTESVSSQEVADYVLKKHPNVKGCYGTSSGAVKEIVGALDRAGMEDVMVVGFDADEEQIELMKDGKVDGLVLQNPFGMGYAAVIAASRAALSMGNEAYVDTGYVWVTKENLQSKEVQKMLGK